MGSFTSEWITYFNRGLPTSFWLIKLCVLYSLFLSFNYYSAVVHAHVAVVKIACLVPDRSLAARLSIIQDSDSRLSSQISD